MDRPHRNALLLLHFTVLIWGLTGIFGRLIQLPADQLVYIRTLIGMAGLAMAAPIMRFPLRPGAGLPRAGGRGRKNQNVARGLGPLAHPMTFGFCA